MAIKDNKVKREDRLTVKMTLGIPDPHRYKSYKDDRRHYIVRVDQEEILNIKEESNVDVELRLRSLVVVKKMFGTKGVDSVMTFRVGENFAIVKIGATELRVAISFNENNVLEILDSSSKIAQSRLLEVKKDE